MASPRGSGPTAPSSGSSPPTPTKGPYRVEENVVKASGLGLRRTPEGTATLLQPVPSQDPEQHQECEDEKGTTDRSRHQGGPRCGPCGPWGA